MEIIRTKDFLNVICIALRPRPSSCTEEDATEVWATDEKDEFIMYPYIQGQF